MSLHALPAIPDPRVFPEAAAGTGEAATLYAEVAASLGAPTALAAATHDREIAAVLAAHLDGDGRSLAALMAGAPSVAVARYLWRALDALYREPPSGGGEIAITVFAIPVVVVAGLEGATAASTLPGVLPDPEALAAILIDHRALAGNRNFALANALVGVDAIEIGRLPEIRAWGKLPDVPPATGDPDTAPVPRALEPAPIVVAPGREAVSLRFVVGTALAKAGADLLANTAVGKWGIPFAQALCRQLSGGRASVLALPRAPQLPLPAAQHGRSAQREVGAQIFVSNAVRRLRGSVGEPVAVISAHRAAGVPGEGELRLSLSSPFSPRDAEGFRCPLYPLDRVGDVAEMLLELLRDCRVTDIRVLADVFPDRDASTGLRLLFKPDTIPPRTEVLVH